MTKAARTSAAGCLASAFVFAVACASTPKVRPVAAARTVPYADVHAILQQRCEHCHNEDKAKGGLLTISYETLIAGGEHGNALVPGDSASSRLMQMIEGKGEPRMPYKEDPLSRSEIDVIRRWIDAGAPAPAAGDAPAAGAVEIPTIRPAVPVPGAVAAVAFDPATRRLAVGGYKTIRLMALDGRQWGAALIGHADLVRAVAFSPDGRRLAAAGGVSGRSGEVKIWNVEAASPKLVSTIQGHTDTILAMAFSPDGATMATASYDKLIKLWEIATGKLLTTFKEHSDAVYAVAFMPGGRQVVSGAGDRTLKVWDVATGKRLVTINDALDAVHAVAVHPSGTYIAAAGADRMIRTWAWNTDVASPGGKSATLAASTFAHGDAVLRLAYAPDGATLVSAGADRTIKMWDAAKLREKQLFEPQPDWVMGLALSPDGRWLAAGRYDGTLGLYTLAGTAAGEQFVVPR
jgi:hypothetical protein